MRQCPEKSVKSILHFPYQEKYDLFTNILETVVNSYV